jgi:hypothetical protein
MSGMIYAVIVIMWAAFLVPMWLRRHDNAAESKSVDRFARKMRILARRTGSVTPNAGGPADRTPVEVAEASSATTAPATARPGVVSSTVRILEPVPRTRLTWEEPPSLVPEPASTAVDHAAMPSARERAGVRERWVDEADDEALAALAAPDLARDLARDRGLGHRPATLAMRRRRVVLLLFGTTAVSAVLGVTSIVTWWVAAATGLLALAYLVHLRIQAKRSAEIARRRTRARPGAARPEVEPSRTVRVARPLPRRAPEPRSGDLLRAASDWEPVATPVPTYVTAPRATRVVRRVDLASGSAWTSGRLVADAAAAGRAAAAAAHDEAVAAEARRVDDPPVARAVGD